MKKFGSLLLAFIMCAALALPVFAVEGDENNEPQKGIVTINKAEAGKTYKLYKILEPNGSGGYQVSPKWYGYGNPNYFVKVEGSQVSYANDPGHPEKGWTAITDSDPVSVGKLLNFVLWNASLTPVQKIEVSSETESVTLDYGYYLIAYGDETGGLFYLDSPTKTITKKTDSDPDIKKSIKLADGTLVDWDSVKLGDEITFVVTAKLPSPSAWGTDNNYSCYLEDIIGDGTQDEADARHAHGLELNPNVAIDINGNPAVTAGQTRVELSNKPGDVIRVEYQDDKKQFSIKFGDTDQNGESDGSLAFLKLHPGAELTITYTATLIQRAEENPREINTAILHYGTETMQDSAYVYDFTIVVDKDDAKDHTPLSGAKFVLMNDEGKFYCSDVKKNDQSYHAGDMVKWLDATLDTKTGRFTLPDTVPEGVDKDSMIKVTDANNENGMHHFEGIAEGRYFLFEIEAPQGYTRMTEAVIIEIEPQKDANGKVVVGDKETVLFQRTISRGNVLVDADGNMLKSADGKVRFERTVQGSPELIEPGGVPWGGEAHWQQLRLEVDVDNTKGTQLPETGGMGTTLFYAAGGILLVGAAVLLIAKRRAGEAE